MKIIIVGAGISGLTCYLYLKKLLPNPPAPAPAHEIIIYESYASPKASQRASEPAPNAERRSLIGGGLGVAPNGMKVLRDLDKELHDEMQARGYPTVNVLLRSARGHDLQKMVDMGSKGELEFLVLCSRQAVWDCVRERVPDEALRTGRVVLRVNKAEGGVPSIELEGGETVEADLIIGADGVKSVVKKAVLGDGIKDDYPPYYTGLTGVGGFIPSDYLKANTEGNESPRPETSAMICTFGAAGFFGYAPCTSGPHTPLTRQDVESGETAPFGDTAMWWSTYESATLPDTTKLDQDEIRKQLLERHGDWADPIITRIVREVDIQSMIPTYVSPILPTWQADGLVLVGDAAHALPPTSGQGVSVALEDAHLLSLLLSHHLHRLYASTPQPPQDALQTSLTTATTAYVLARKPRVERIRDFALRMSDHKRKKGLVGEYFSYLLVWIMGLLMPRFMAEMVGGYDVPTEAEKAFSA